MKLFLCSLIFVAVAIGKAMSDSGFPSKKPHLAARLVKPHEQGTNDRTTHKPTSITAAPSPGSLGGSIKMTASPSTPVAPVPTSPTLPGHIASQDSTPDRHRGPHAPQAPRTVQPTLNKASKMPVKPTPKPKNPRRAPRFRPTPPTNAPTPRPTQSPTCLASGVPCTSPSQCCNNSPCINNDDDIGHCNVNIDPERP